MLDKLIQDLHEIFNAVKSYPMSTKQICEYLKIHQNHNIEVFEIRQYLWDELKAFVIYNKYDYSYSIKKNVEFSDVNKLLERRYNRKLDLQLSSNIDSLNNKKDLFEGIYDYSEKSVFTIAQAFLKDEYFNLDQIDERFRDIIISVVKDNRITEVEEKFLKQKSLEFEIDLSIIETTHNALNSNNPYLDNIIHVIYEDRIITKDEILFIQEKVFENEINRDAAIKRFWQIGFVYYPTTFQKLNGLQEFLSLQYIASELLNNGNYRFKYPDIFSCADFNTCLKASISSYKKMVLSHLQSIDINITDMLLDQHLHIYTVDDLIDFRGPIVDSKKADISKTELLNIIHSEKLRIGSPDAALFAENIKFRLGI